MEPQRDPRGLDEIMKDLPLLSKIYVVTSDPKLQIRYAQVISLKRELFPEKITGSFYDGNYTKKFEFKFDVGQIECLEEKGIWAYLKESDAEEKLKEMAVTRVQELNSDRVRIDHEIGNLKKYL